MLFKKTLLVASAYALSLAPLQTLAAGPVQFSSLFQAIPAGKPGSCASYNMDQMVNDALTLTDHAVAALDVLLKGKVPATTTNYNLLEMAEAMWGITFKQSANPIPGMGTHEITSGMRDLRTARLHYTMVLNELRSTRQTGARVTCGDQDFMWVKRLGDFGIQGDSANELISRKWGLNPREHPGFWLSDYFSPFITVRGRDGKRYRERNQADLAIVNSEGAVNGKPTICELDPNMAETWIPSKFMTYCKGVLRMPSLSHQIAKQARFRKGDSINEYAKTPGGYMVHEMMHWINKGIIDERTSDRRKAYGWEGCGSVAQDGKSTTNADNYRMWAVATTLSQVRWRYLGDGTDCG